MRLLDSLKYRIFGLDRLEVPKYKPVTFKAPDGAAERDPVRAQVAPAQSRLKLANEKSLGNPTEDLI